MGIGQNLLSWVQGELVPILSVVLMVTAIVFLAKREMSKFVTFLILAILAILFVVFTSDVVSVLGNIGRRLIGAG